MILWETVHGFEGQRERDKGEETKNREGERALKQIKTEKRKWTEQNYRKTVAPVTSHDAGYNHW